MGDDNRGFSKLNEETVIHGNGFHFHTSSPVEVGGLHNGTRINLGFGRVKAERDEGSLRIGGLALAANCQYIVLIFGFFFLLAGAVLTALAYKTKPDKAIDVSSRDEGKVAGPLFVVIGSLLIIMGIGLTLVGWKVNQEAKRQLNRFSLQTPPPPTSDAHEYINTFAGIHDSTIFPRSSTSSQYSRHDSVFNTNFFTDRRRTLPTIAQAVPVGFFMDGKLSCGVSESGSLGTSHSRPQSSHADKLNGNSKEFETDGLSFNQAKIHSPHRKASLSLRPSLPIPIIASPSFIRSRVIAPLDPNCLMRAQKSDEPFGSIVSLSGTGDIACFPTAPPTLFAPCLEETGSSCENISETVATASATSPISCRELPTIQVSDLAHQL